MYPQSNHAASPQRWGGGACGARCLAAVRLSDSGFHNAVQKDLFPRCACSSCATGELKMIGRCAGENLRSFRFDAAKTGMRLTTDCPL